jgi:transposase
VGKFAPRGQPDRSALERLAARGLTLREIATDLDRSVATVRYWLARWKIHRPDARRHWIDPATAPAVIQSRCARHGHGPFRLEGRGYYRCKACRQAAVAARRRKVKRVLVEEAGGRCGLCGYDRCVSALQFHHSDPRQKTFGLSSKGVTRGLVAARAEVRKCVLLCANCHAEVEAGCRRLDAA